MKIRRKEKMKKIVTKIFPKMKKKRKKKIDGIEINFFFKDEKQKPGEFRKASIKS